MSDLYTKQALLDKLTSSEKYVKACEWLEGKGIPIEKLRVVHHYKETSFFGLFKKKVYLPIPDEDWETYFRKREYVYNYYYYREIKYQVDKRVTEVTNSTAIWFEDAPTETYDPAQLAIICMRSRDEGVVEMRVE